MRVEAEGVDVELAGRTVLAGAVLCAEPGTTVGLLGPNGSGKTTLLRTVYRALRPRAGRVLVGDSAVWELGARRAARRTAVVMQDDPTEFEFTVPRSSSSAECRTRGCWSATPPSTTRSSTRPWPGPGSAGSPTGW